MIDVCHTPLTESSQTSQTSLGTKLYKQTISKGKKAYQCIVPECGKIIRYKSDMERHMIVHIESKPFVCTFSGCRKTFKREDALRNHLQSHSQELTFVCSEPGCGLKFRKKAILQYHIGKNHSTPTFVCENPGCHRTFATYKGLRKHQGAGCGLEKVCVDSEAEEVKIALTSASDDFEVAQEDFEGPKVDFVDRCFSFDERSPKPEKHFHADVYLEGSEISSGNNYQCYFSETQSSNGLDPHDECLEFGSKDFLRSFLKRLHQENQDLRGKLDDAVSKLDIREEDLMAQS